MTTASSYIVGAIRSDGSRALVLDELATYDEALAVHKAVVRGSDVRDLVVRSADDPAWRGLPSAGTNYEKPATWARRDYRRRELGRTVTALLKSGRDLTVYQLERDAVASLVARGLPKPDAYDVERAIKSRVTLGRCRGRTGRERGPAFYWPKREGRVGDKSCPHCGTRLSQTSLAYDRSFERFHEREDAA